MQIYLNRLSLAVLLTLLSSPLQAQELNYQVTLSGLPAASELYSLVVGASQLIALQSRPPIGLYGLRYRADIDRRQIRTVLRSRGYYSGTVSVSWPALPVSPVQVMISVELGAQYRLRALTVSYHMVPAQGPVPQTEYYDLTTENRPATAAEVLAVSERALDNLKGAGYARAVTVGQRLVVDHDSLVMDVFLEIDRGQVARFGELFIRGLVATDEEFIRSHIPWQVGDILVAELLDQSRDHLEAHGLFTSIDFEPSFDQERDGLVPVILTITERARHVVGLGLNFSTDEELRAHAGWSHRNLFGRGEQLRLSGELEHLNFRRLRDGSLNRLDIPFLVSASLRKPDFLAEGQDLLIAGQFFTREQRSFDSEVARLRLSLGQSLDLADVNLAGISLEGYRARRAQTSQSGMLLGLPLVLRWDFADDLHSPSSGIRVRFSLSPYLQNEPNWQAFLTARTTIAGYQALGADGGYVLAGRLTFGTAAAGSSIPWVRRFFVGGDGSLRGVPYQTGGADPAVVGGRSLLESGIELRARVAEKLSLIYFVEAGDVFTRPWPGFAVEPRLTTGVGVRFLTDVGPIRVDIGFPINRRTGLDIWQLYIGLGQSF